METPTLNKKQQRATLSAKKIKSKETIKSVIATPYTPYWPQISPEDHNTLKQILEQNLPRIAPEKINIHWRDLKNIPKPERKMFRKEHAKKYQTEVKENDRRGVIIGVNDVTKLLENNLASAILISSDAQPKLIVQHIVDQAVLYRVPVIIVDNLRELLRNVCGVGSVVLGISKDINIESKLNLIRDSVAHIFEKCPAPVDHINYNRSLESKSVKNVSTTKKALTFENTVSEEQIRQTVYLKRDSTSKRVFVPECNEKPLRSDKMEVDSEGFLPFAQEPEQKIKNKVKSNYKSLIVKRLKGDSNRNKRIINTLKRKLK